MKIAAHDWMHIKVDSNSKQQSVRQSQSASPSV